ncbi:hypothetical protein V6N13_085471 [Hibiscus sabdariffa]
MWEGNKRVDWRVLEHDSRIAEEDTGMIQRVGSGSKDRAMIAEVIEIGRQQRKVRQLYEILMSEVPPEDRVMTTKEIPKRGRGRPKTKITESNQVVNGSLSDSDFVNRKKVILKEATETVHLGKLIGAVPKGNESAVIQDIAREDLVW